MMLRTKVKKHLPVYEETSRKETNGGEGMIGSA